MSAKSSTNGTVPDKALRQKQARLRSLQTGEPARCTCTEAAPEAGPDDLNRYDRDRFFAARTATGKAPQVYRRHEWTYIRGELVAYEASHDLVGEQP